MLAGAVGLFLAGLGWKAVHASTLLPPLAVRGTVVDWSDPEPAPIASEIETPAKSSPVRAKAVLPSGPLDLNTATLAQLETLPGIGPSLAQRIADARSEHPFRSLADLDRVKGIGPAKLEKLRPHLLF